MAKSPFVASTARTTIAIVDGNHSLLDAGIARCEAMLAATSGWRAKAWQASLATLRARRGAPRSAPKAAPAAATYTEAPASADPIATLRAEFLGGRITAVEFAKSVSALRG